ncbi:MAG: hypothetical protein WC456_03265 [Patescibacteria group bacterium]
MPKLSHKLYRVWIFALGVSATIAYRIIIFLDGYEPYLMRAVWYVGTIGFVWYFIHRFRIENRRDRLITDLKLADKISDQTPLDAEERAALTYILSGLQTSLAKWNYIVIFIVSTLALAFSVYQDIIPLIK